MLLHAINYKCHPDSLQFVSFPAPCDSAGAVLIFRRNPCEAGEGSEEKLEFIPVCHHLVVLWRPEAQICFTPLSYLNWKRLRSACHGILSDNPYLTCWEILLPLSLPIPALIFFFSFLFVRKSYTELWWRPYSQHRWPSLPGLPPLGPESRIPLLCLNAAHPSQKPKINYQFRGFLPVNQPSDRIENSSVSGCWRCKHCSVATYSQGEELFFLPAWLCRIIVDWVFRSYLSVQLSHAF